MSIQSSCGEGFPGDRLIDIRRFKAFARKNYPRSWLLRELVLMEDDLVPAWVLMVYMRVWLRLLELELRGHGRRTGEVL